MPKLKKEHTYFTCLVCQKKGRNKKGKGRRRYYCSKTCMTKAMWERWEKRNPVTLLRKDASKENIKAHLLKLLKKYE